MAQRDVHRAEAGADRRRDRALQRDPVRASSRRASPRAAACRPTPSRRRRPAARPTRTSTPVASSTRRVASVSSGPVPSPGMRVTRCAIARASLHTALTDRRATIFVYDSRREHDQRLQARVSKASSPSRPRSRSPIARAASFATAASTSTSSSATIPYENVWGLLVDDDLDSAMPEPEPYEPARSDGQRPADLQAETRALAGVLEARQAERDLRRAGARRSRRVSRRR